MNDILTADMRQLLESVADRHRYPLLFATVSGAHLYGFPEFHKQEFERLLNKLEDDSRESTLPEQPSAQPALDDLLKRVRLQ